MDILETLRGVKDSKSTTTKDEYLRQLQLILGLGLGGTDFYDKLMDQRYFDEDSCKAAIPVEGDHLTSEQIMQICIQTKSVAIALEAVRSNKLSVEQMNKLKELHDIH